MPTTRIAIAQLLGAPPTDVPPERKHANSLRELERRLEEAGTRRPDVIVTGEAINRYGFGPHEAEPDEPIGAGPFHDLAAGAARSYGCYVCYAVTGPDDVGRRRNAAVLVDRNGQTVGMYHKVHCTDGEREGGIVAGDGFPVFQTDVGPVGILICHDMSFPESARCLMLGGARLLLWPSNWSGWGEHISYVVIASRAIDNAATLAFASRGHDPDDVNWLAGTHGRSAVFSPEGRVLAEMPDRRPGVLACDVDLTAERVAPHLTKGKDDVFREVILRERRPEAYTALTRATPGGSNETPPSQ